MWDPGAEEFEERVGGAKGERQCGPQLPGNQLPNDQVTDIFENVP